MHRTEAITLTCWISHDSRPEGVSDKYFWGVKENTSNKVGFLQTPVASEGVNFQAWFYKALRFFSLPF